ARASAGPSPDIQGSSAEAKPGPERGPEPQAAPGPVKRVRELAERVANLPPVPDLLPPPPVPDRERELAREVAEQVANLDAPASAPQPETRLLHLTPAPKPEPEPSVFMGSDERLLSIEALLKERQRAFIEMVTTTETLRMKIARLEEILEERDRELAKLRIARAV